MLRHNFSAEVPISGDSIRWTGEVIRSIEFRTIGLDVSMGASAFYSVPYVPLAHIAMYWVGPKIWSKAKAKGYLTQADYLRGSYNSRTLDWLTAFFGILSLLPYIQLQITGLGIVISVATHGEINDDATALSVRTAEVPAVDH